jgi:hypothetical protein
VPVRAVRAVVPVPVPHVRLPAAGGDRVNPFKPGTEEYDVFEHQEAAEGAMLLDQLYAALLRYVIFPTASAADAVTLWIAATHAQPSWEHAPRCAVISPEKRCGKSRLMDVAEATAHGALVTVNISPAALVRSIGDQHPPTLFVDEADTIFGPKSADNHEDLRGIINSGHQRGRPYIRYDVTSRRVEHMPTFAMCMLAGIGDLPDTIMDRAVVVRMRRRAAGERVDPYRTRRDRPALHELRDRLHAWIAATDRLDKLTEIEPVMPVEDRAADTWEPLIAVADLAGGDWPKRARKACLELVATESAADVEGSLGVKLLADIRDLYRDFTVGFMPSAELLARLHKIDESPWRDLPLTLTGLAARLKPYAIKPGRDTTGKVRGYRHEDFADAFSRYIPPEPVKPSEPGSDQGKQPDGSKPSDGSTRQRPQPVSDLTSGFDGLTPSDDWARDLYDRER